MYRGFLLLVCFIKISHQGSISNESFQNLSRSKRQSSNHCALPDHPVNGQIKILGQEQDPYYPNTNVRLNTIIDLTCTNGTATQTGGLSRAICYQGRWKPTIPEMGGCVRGCQQVPTESDTLYVTCKHKNPKINCYNPIEGTVIEVVCKPFYENASSQSVITCRNGRWDGDISQCQPQCGKKGVPVDVLVVGGSDYKISEYPWVAAIYRSNVQFSGGATIISRHFVLSAAHLFQTSQGDVLDKSNFIVTAGKFFENFFYGRDKYMQYSRVKRLHILESFGGHLRNLIGDLAIVRLEDPFTLTEYVLPVCIDWTNAFESEVLKEDNKGIIAGWGFQEEHGNISPEIRMLEVPYKSRGTCELSEEVKKSFFTYDKFCAGYVNKKTSVCVGDTGGGLFFESTDNKYYLRGILSYTPGKSGGCDSNGPALYTKVSTYLREIGKEINRSV